MNFSVGDIDKDINNNYTDENNTNNTKVKFFSLFKDFNKG
jgi:hypothetical protein